ncbi:MAG: 4'-phosphopantetheinyl transferase, partial [candidate division NC10 bacterium]|nr:4'-phosphopantetheinyl transferase [candidate division NC10 bacterium]
MSPPAADGEVVIWPASLARDLPLLERLAATLSRDELTRAGRFHFPRDRSRFLAARGFLRRILSAYAGETPGSLRFEYSPEGKPFLPRHPTLRFNLSHSDDRLLVGVCRGRSIGVDIERVPTPEVVDSVSAMTDPLGHTVNLTYDAEG